MADLERRSISRHHGEAKEPLGWNPALGSRGNLDFFRKLTIPDRIFYFQSIGADDNPAIWRQLIDDWSKYAEGKRALAAYSQLLPFELSHPEVARTINRFCLQALDDPDIDTTLQLHVAASVERGYRFFSTPRDTSPQARVLQRANRKIRDTEELLAKKYIKSETFLVNAEETHDGEDDLGINAIVEKLQGKTHADFLSIDVDAAEPVNGKKRLVVRWVNMPKDYQEGARLLAAAYEICPDLVSYPGDTNEHIGTVTNQASRYSYAYIIMQNWQRMIEDVETDNTRLHYCWQVATHIAATAPDLQKLILANDWTQYAGMNKAQPGTLQSQKLPPVSRRGMDMASQSRILDGIMMPNVKAPPPKEADQPSLYQLNTLVDLTLAQIGAGRSAETEQRLENFLRVYYRVDYDMFYDILTHTMKRKDIVSNDNMAFAFMEAAHKSAGAPIPENLRELTDAIRRPELSVATFDLESLHPQPVKYMIVIGGPKIFDEPPEYTTHISGRVRDHEGKMFPRGCADGSLRSSDYLHNYLTDYLVDSPERNLEQAIAELDTLMAEHHFDLNHGPYIARFLVALEREIIETSNYPEAAVSTLNRLLEYYRPYIDNIGLLPLTVGILHLATPTVNNREMYESYFLAIQSAWNLNPAYQITLMRQLRIFHGHFIDSVGISLLDEEQMKAMERMQAVFPAYEEEKVENLLFRGYNTLLGMHNVMSAIDNHESRRPNSDYARAYTSHLERTQATIKKIERRLTAQGPAGILKPMIAIWGEIDAGLRTLLLKDCVAANGIYRPYIVQLSEKLATAANLEFMVNTFLPWALDEERQNVLMLALENIGKTLENDALKAESAKVSGNIARSIISSILSHWPQSPELQDDLLDASIAPDGFLRPLWQFIASHLDDPENLSFMTDQILPLIRKTPSTESLLHLVFCLANRKENQAGLPDSKFALLQTALGFFDLPRQVINLRRISDMLSDRIFIGISGGNQLHAVSPIGFPRAFPYRMDDVPAAEYSILLSGRVIGEFEDAPELPVGERVARSIRRAINQDDEIIPWLNEIDRDTLLLTVVADRFRDLPGMSRPIPEDRGFFPFALLTEEHRRAEDAEYPRVQFYRGETDDSRDLYGLSGYIHFAPGLYFRFDVTCDHGIQSGYTEYIDAPTRTLIEKAILSHLYEEVVNPEKLLALVEKRLSNRPGKAFRVGNKNPQKRIRATSEEMRIYLEELEGEYTGPAEIAEWSDSRGGFFLAISGNHGFWDYKDWQRVVDRKLIDKMMQKYRVVFIGRPVNIKSAIEVPHRGTVRVFDDLEKAAIAAGFTKPPPAHLALLPYGHHPTQANILQAGSDLFGFHIYTGAMLVPDPAHDDYYAIEFFMTFKPPQPDVEGYQRAQRLAQQ